jgi:hypothetical protein
LPYATAQALINDIASHYDDTDATTYTLPASKLARYLHYIQRTVDEIVNYKPWSWKMAFKTINFTAGQSDLPADFANVGPNGALFDSIGEPWAEINFQNMVGMKAAGRHITAHYFCVGRRLASTSAAIGDGGIVGGDVRALMIPDPANTAAFTIFYETSPPIVVITDPLPVPESFHNAVLLGSVAKLQEGKADPRDIWRAEYVSALAKQVALLTPMSSRVRQMPMSSGRRMW